MKIHQKMAAILAAVGAVGKDRKNPSQGYNYRGIDDALYELHPLFAKHGVYLQLSQLVPVFSNAGETSKGKEMVRCVLTGTVRFVCGEDGSSTEASLVGEGTDTGDKALMKALANGLKYVLWYTYAIPTEEKLDSEAYEDEPVEEPKQAAKKQSSKSSKKSEPAQEQQTEEPTAAHLELDKKGADLLKLVKATKTADELKAMRVELRAWAEAAKEAGPPLHKRRQQVVDEFTAQWSKLGA